MTTTKDVMSAVNDLQNALSTTELSLSDLPEAINNRNIGTIQTTFANSEEDKEAINKWFNHYQNGEQHTSAVDTLSVTPDGETTEYVVVESEMYSKRKGEHNQTGTYHARWVVGKDDSTAQEYFIHRLDWQQSFEEGLESIDNPVETVRSWLGFSEYLPTNLDNIEYKTWYQVQGDIAIQLKPLSSHITSTARNRKSEYMKKVEEEAFEEWKAKDETIQQHNDISTSYSHYGRLSVRLKGKTTTENLKTLQDDLGLTEEEVREQMRDSWKQLTADRRESIIESQIQSEITDYINSNTPDENDVLDKFESELETELTAEAGQQNIIIGNHLILCDNAVQTSPQRGAEARIVIPEASAIHFIHDEHSDKYREFKQIVIEIKTLDRHENA